jgi:hypothetical protein
MSLVDARMREAADRARHKHHLKAMEGDFLSRVQSNKKFSRLLGVLSKRTGMAVQDLNVVIEDMLRLCWSEAGVTVINDEQMAPFRDEIQRLKKQMNACNLSAQKQIEYLRTDGSADSESGDDAVVFFEPLEYLDEGTRDLVMSIVLDKVKLVEKGHAPPSLVHALTNRAHKRTSGFEGTAEEQLELTLAELEELKEELKESRAMQADAEEVVKKLRLQVSEMEHEEKAAAKLREEVQDLNQKMLQLQEEAAAQIALIEELRSQVELEQERIEVLEQRIRGAANKVTEHVQTDLHGSDWDRAQDEVKKLKVMLEEAQMKFKELMDKCKSKGGGFKEAIEEITSELGMQEIFSKRAVFNRLYEDAQRRIEKLERVRVQLKIERGRTMSAASEPEKQQLRRLIVDEAGEVPAMRAIEQSDLEGFQRIYTEALARAYPSKREIYENNRYDPGTPPVAKLWRQPSPPAPVRAEAPSSWWVATSLQGVHREAPTQDIGANGGPLRGGLRLQSSPDIHNRVSSNAALFVAKKKTQNTSSLPSLPPSRVVAHRLEAANAPLQRVFEQSLARARGEASSAAASRLSAPRGRHLV